MINHRIHMIVKNFKYCLFAITALTYGAPPINAAENYLKNQHESRLIEYQKEEITATNDFDKAVALRGEAAELDSLNQPKEALSAIDRALKIAQPNQSKDFLTIKAGILFNLNKPQEALELLTPEIEIARKLADTSPVTKRPIVLGEFTESFITATFAHMQLEQWGNAIGTLADAESPLEGPSFYAYKGLLYRYIMTRAGNSSLSNPSLEKLADYYTKYDTGHYGALLRMWQGKNITVEVSNIIEKMKNSEQQDASSEVLFYSAAYEKFVKGNSPVALEMLEQLNTLSPYGSIEWIYGNRVLK
jgi:tetratricopeptide (TPR) repeat protein